MNILWSSTKVGCCWSFPGSHRPGAGRVHAARQQGDRERAVRALPHQDLQEDSIAHRQLSQSGTCLMFFFFKENLRLILTVLSYI